MAESIVNEAPATIPSHNDMFNAAHLKLETARAIVDILTMLDVTGDTSSLKKGSLTACLLHAEEMLGEAGEMFSNAWKLPAEVHHGE